MPKFITSDFERYSKWTDSAKFISKDRTVVEDGKPFTSSYKGHLYRLISKKERNYSIAERIGRGLLGTAAVIFTLGIAILFKPVRSLLTKGKENIRFAISEDSISEKELQNGVVISDDTIAKIQAFLEGKNTENITKYPSNNNVFSLTSAPDYIFKTSAYQSSSMYASKRYQKMVAAQTVCRVHQLALLVIPNAALLNIQVDGKQYQLIAERKLDFNSSKQEEYFETYASTLNETIRQLSVFICKTGYDDVEWRNNPILNDHPDELGRRKIGLIDLEEVSHRNSETIGLFGGGLERRGLVGCINEDQAQIVADIAQENGISTESFETARSKRKAELENNRQLKKFHHEHHITSGYEPLQVDISSLGLDLTQEAEIRFRVGGESNAPIFETKKFTLRKVVEDLINYINTQIRENSSNCSVKEKRNIIINCGSECSLYHDLGLKRVASNITQEEQKERWLYQILDALKVKGHIYDMNFSGYDYEIQA